MRSDLSELAVTNGNTQLMIQDFRKESEAAMSSFMFDVTKSIDKKMIMASQTVDSIIRDAIVREFNAFKSLPNNQDPSWSKGHLPPMNDVPRIQPVSNNQKVNTGFQEVRQKIWKRLFRTRIGDIRVWFISSSIGGKFSLSSITVLKVTFHSRSRFLKKGRSCELQWENSAFSSPKLTVPVFRAWNFVNEDSPISGACKAGNLQEVVNLFQSRQASPFDRVWVDKHDDYASLLTLVAEGFWEMMFKASKWSQICDDWAMSQVQPYLGQSLKLIKLLVGSGLNAGEVQWGFCGKINFLNIGEFAATWDLYLMPSVLPYAEDYLRFVIDQSTINPFSNTERSDLRFLLWLHKHAPNKSPMTSMLLQQDKWLIEESSPNLAWFSILNHVGLLCTCPSMFERDPEGTVFRELLLSSKRSTEASGALDDQYWNLFKERLAYDLTPDMPDNTRRAFQNYIAIYIEAGMDLHIIKQDLQNNRFHIDYANHLDGNDSEHLYADLLGKRYHEETVDLTIHQSIFYGALKQCQWTDSDIDDWEREDQYASLAYQLFYLEVPYPSDIPENFDIRLAYKYINYSYWRRYLKDYDEQTSGQPPIETEEDDEEDDEENDDEAASIQGDPDTIICRKIYDNEEFSGDEECYDESSNTIYKRISIDDFMTRMDKKKSKRRKPRKLIKEREVQDKAVSIQSKQRNMSKTLAILPILLFTFLALFRYVALPFLISLLIK